MSLRFVKMHGLGNDFIVVDAINQSVQLDPPTVRRLADRHTGIGCDQVLLVQPATRSDVDFTYRIFNADGDEVEQCGNGARCFARFVREQGLSSKTRIRAATRAGVIELLWRDDGQVTVDMGMPRFDPGEIPFVADERADAYRIEVDGTELLLGVLSMGNPHAVLQVKDLDSAPVLQLGASLERHPRFPQRVNVGFMEVVTRSEIRLRVFERGVGETRACGTGACAAAVVGRLRGLLEQHVAVQLAGGTLQIHWPGEGSPVLMTGPTARVFDGTIDV